MEERKEEQLADYEPEDLVEQQLEEVGLVHPPDGKWGWVVVAASFMINVIVDGIIFTAGQGFQPQWEQYYGASSGSSAWTVSLLSGGYLFAGRYTCLCFCR